MSKKLSNDENLKNLKKRKIIRIFTICFAIATIILSILCIFLNISYLFPIITMIITHLLLTYREKIPINKVDDLKYYRKVSSK